MFVSVAPCVSAVMKPRSNSGVKAWGWVLSNNMVPVVESVSMSLQPETPDSPAVLTLQVPDVR